MVVPVTGTPAILPWMCLAKVGTGGELGKLGGGHLGKGPHREGSRARSREVERMRGPEAITRSVCRSASQPVSHPGWGSLARSCVGLESRVLT
jgi:hypothetical protein